MHEPSAVDLTVRLDHHCRNLLFSPNPPHRNSICEDSTAPKSSPFLLVMGSSSGPSASSSSSSYQGSQGTVQSNGPANLGAMSSLDPSCTPLKHRYDSCFNSWFQDYLAVPLVSGSSSSSSSNASASKSSDKKCTFFDELGSESYGSKSRADNDSLKRLRAAKREELESKCGPIFAEYQACVKVRMHSGKHVTSDAPNDPSQLIVFSSLHLTT